jgi:hypothetical protein
MEGPQSLRRLIRVALLGEHRQHHPSEGDGRDERQWQQRSPEAESSEDGDQRLILLRNVGLVHAAILTTRWLRAGF